MKFKVGDKVKCLNSWTTHKGANGIIINIDILRQYPIKVQFENSRYKYENFNYRQIKHLNSDLIKKRLGII